MPDLPQHNTGLIPDLTPNVWIGGSIPYVVNNESADWRPYVANYELQRDPLETMACVTFSLLNNLEIQHKFRGVDINLADRFTAKVSDTQMNGNTFENVADSCRASSSRCVGVVKEPIWPNNKYKTWAEYYANIPQEVLQKALKVDFNYEIIPRSTDWANTLRYNLKQCPLWITWPANPYHAMTVLFVKPDNINAVALDHYDQQIKTIKVSDIAIAARVVLNKLINEETMQLIKDNGVVYLQVTPEIKFGIADPETLTLFGPAPIIEGKTTGIETFTISKGFILNKK